jgi:MFS transporter, DHA1 family, tetracycline resistance protein
MSEPAVESIVEATADAPRGAAVAFIFVTILLDTLALGIIIPILPKLIESFVDDDPPARRASSACSGPPGH